MERLISMVFKDIPNYPNYKISECGKKIIRKSFVNKRGIYLKEKEIKIQLSKTGYLTVTLIIGNEMKSKLLHRLVALTFIPNPHNKPQVNHKDFDKTNCHKNNLEWNTDKENKEHAVLNGLTARGERNANTVLNLDIVNSIKADLNAGIRPYKVIAEKYNTSVYNVSDIKNKRSWNY